MPQSVMTSSNIHELNEYHGQPGTYAVTAVLAIPGMQTHFDVLNPNDIADSGDSLILLPDGQRHRFDVLSEIGPISVQFLTGERG